MTTETSTKTKGNGHEGDDRSGISERVMEVGSQMDELADNVRGVVDDAHEKLRREAKRSPYRTVGIAAIAGFVLGGGLSPSVMRVAAGIGGRLLLASMLERLVRERKPQ